MMGTPLSRRDFIKTTAVAGVAIRIGFIAPDADAITIDGGSALTRDWIGPDGKLKYRLDAIGKVTGQKTFARDYRAADMVGWPKQQSHALLIHATKADRTFEGIDLSMLGSDLQPDRIVLAEDLERDSVALPDPGSYGEVILVAKGRTPPMLGHPVALLVYKDFARYDAAKRRLRFNEDVVRYGAHTGPKVPPHYGVARYVRLQSETPDPEGRYAPQLDSTIFGKFDGDTMLWPAGDAKGTPPAQGMAAAADIAREIAAPGDGMLMLTRDYFSQSVDGSALEADNGNAWYDPATGVLHMVLATQSPYEVAIGAAEMLSKTKIDLGKTKKLDLQVPYTVGYGTKERAAFAYYCVLAGLYGEGLPVRLANDRFEQFQLGIKRHAFWMKDTIVADKKTGKFKIFKAEFKNDGGGRPGVSMNVGNAGAKSAQSFYYFPKSDVTTAALASRAPEAGATRGYGSVQTLSATEMLVDEAAELLGIDPIELRLRNIATLGARNVAPDAPALRNEEILLKARAHPLWSGRKERKAKFEADNPGKKYGVGFAHVQRGFGTAAEAGVASVAIDANGRITLRHIVNEIGAGTTIAQAVMVGNILGRVPDRTHFGVVDWPEMPLTSMEKPYTTPQEKEDQLKLDPRWTPSFSSNVAASNGVYYYGHSTRQAAHALLRFGLWPAALAIWAQGPNGGKAGSANYENASFDRGKLRAGDLEPLPLEQVAAKAHEMGLITGVAVHTFNRNRGGWAEAEFDIPGTGRVQLPIDGLSVQYGEGAPAGRKALMTSGGFHFIARSSVSYPGVRDVLGLTHQSSIANLVEVAVDPAIGNVNLLSHHSILECGTQVAPQLVSGQVQGALAMGVGHALYEYLPLYEDGPGDGTWNWDRYHLPRATEVAVWNQTMEVLPARSDADPPKGIGELVMIAITPAIANAVTDAIGKRFYELPITPEKIRGDRA
jgi:CO/xanthine dehydrogenase Mo-binding subunit